jgi:hypothetical protein
MDGLFQGRIENPDLPYRVLDIFVIIMADDVDRDGHDEFY